MDTNSKEKATKMWALAHTVIYTLMFLIDANNTMESFSVAQVLLKQCELLLSDTVVYQFLAKHRMVKDVKCFFKFNENWVCKFTKIQPQLVTVEMQETMQQPSSIIEVEHDVRANQCLCEMALLRTSSFLNLWFSRERTKYSYSIIAARNFPSVTFFLVILRPWLVR